MRCLNLIAVLVVAVACQVSKTAATGEEDSGLRRLIPSQLNETCLEECSQRAATSHETLATKYPQHEEEIASFPLTAGFLADYCAAHRQNHACRETCGNLSSVDPRLTRVVWSLPHLICHEEFQRLTSKLNCLLDAKKLANATCVSNCNTQRPSPTGANCSKYVCVFDCQKPSFDQKCGAEITTIVRRVRTHGWPVCEHDH